MEKQCEHDACICELGDEQVTQEGHQYCSQGCADGEGCDHPDCGCAEHTA